jgi:Holliday junction resolvase-like predicted endonuclease
MSTTQIGRQAEQAVADDLVRKGYQILDQNWRTRFCEIDIVAKKDGVVYFVEVKFRASTSQGDGLDYILPKKLKHMRFAAETWCSQKWWDGDCRLAAVAVTWDGKRYIVGEFLEVN